MYKIITDGSWDMGSEYAKQLDVKVIPYMITTDEVHYYKEIEELPVRDLYQNMIEHPGLFPKTSLPELTDYYNAFEEYASQGIDIICFTVNAKFSGSYNGACNMREEILGKYPDRRITVLDSTMVTLMQGLLIWELVKYQRAGASYDQIIERFEEIKDSANIFFTVENMDYLVHGGRVGKLAGISANVLNLRPMIRMNKGELYSSGLARGRKQSRDKVLKTLMDYVKENGNDPSRFSWIVGYGYDIEEGEMFREMLLEMLAANWPDFKPEIPVGQIGATIGVHTGPHPLGVGIIERR